MVARRAYGWESFASNSPPSSTSFGQVRPSGVPPGVIDIEKERAPVDQIGARQIVRAQVTNAEGTLEALGAYVLSEAMPVSPPNADNARYVNLHGIARAGPGRRASPA